MENNNTCDAGVGLAAGHQLATITNAIKEVNGMPLVVVPNTFKVEQLPSLLKAPLRKTGKMQLLDLESFARFFNEHKTDRSVIVVDVDPKGTRGAVFTAIFNYHGKKVEEADFGDFRACYTAQMSVEWQRWMGQNGKPLLHSQFLEHLEDNQEIIVEPKGADLMALISSLEGKVDARFANALSLHNGKMKLSYEEDVELRGAGNSATKQGALEVPAELVVGIPPFEFGVTYKVRSRLRYRVQSRQLVFSYEVVDPHRIIQDAASGQVQKVKEITSVQPLYGTAN